MGSYLGTKGPKNHFENYQKLAIFHVFFALEPYNPYIESDCSLLHTLWNVPMLNQSFMGLLE